MLPYFLLSKTSLNSAECPAGSYKASPEPGDIRSCTPCPGSAVTSPPGSSSPSDCQCQEGYRDRDGQCSLKDCPPLTRPLNGDFSHNECRNVFNATCRIRCDEGYEVSGSCGRLRASLVLCSAGRLQRPALPALRPVDWRGRSLSSQDLQENIFSAQRVDQLQFGELWPRHSLSVWLSPRVPATRQSGTLRVPVYRCLYGIYQAITTQRGHKMLLVGGILFAFSCVFMA